MSAFSEAIDALRRLDPSQRQQILVELVNLVRWDRGGSDFIRLADQDDKAVAFLLPPDTGRSEPPVLTPEEEEELRNQLENPGDVLTTQELIALIRSGAPVATEEP
jgi:hypothetical protein